MNAYKSIFCAVTLFFAMTSMASNNGELWSADFCASAQIQCDEPFKFMHDQDGRCGCLSDDDYLSAETCMSAFILCHEDQGSYYSTLMHNEEYVGCGCFKTRASK